jgi:hypothetical protein
VFGGVGGGVGPRPNLGCGDIPVFGSPWVTPSPARRFAGLRTSLGSGVRSGLGKRGKGGKRAGVDGAGSG